MEKSDPGHAQELAPGLSGLIAPNPGPMTHWGTNTFLIGEREIAVIDPGPDNDDHLSAILTASAAGEITHILVTHAHRDHSPLARKLAMKTRAEVLAFGPATAGRSAVMEQLSHAGLSGGGEGVDTGFAPDRHLRDGDRILGEGWEIEVLHTPGHFAGHLAFRWGDRLFSGDHVMDWASSLVSPPDGDLTDFMATSRRLAGLAGLVFHPAHGGPLTDPAGRLGWLIAHREGREAAILNALGRTSRTIPAITASVYTDLNPSMRPAAERNVFAHLIDLVGKELVLAEPLLSHDAEFKLT